MSPKLLFHAPWPYNHTLRRLMGNPAGYPDMRTLEKNRDKLVKAWKANNGDELLSLIPKRLGWPWQRERHNCYVTGIDSSFSDPMTIGNYDAETSFDHVVHEMIHRYLVDFPVSKRSPKWPTFAKKYSNELRRTRSHISVLAIHGCILLESGFAERVTDIRKKHAKFTPYKRAWEIVDSEGREEVLDLLKAR